MTNWCALHNIFWNYFYINIYKNNNQLQLCFHKILMFLEYYTVSYYSISWQSDYVLVLGSTVWFYTYNTQCMSVIGLAKWNIKVHQEFINFFITLKEKSILLWINTTKIWKTRHCHSSEEIVWFRKIHFLSFISSIKQKITRSSTQVVFTWAHTSEFNTLMFIIQYNKSKLIRYFTVIRK